MSMTVSQQSPVQNWAFDEDAAKGSLVSLTGLSASSFGAYAPGAVELKSATSTTKKGVVRANITVRVPIATFSKDGAKSETLGDFLQASLSVTCPNKAGIIGSTANTDGVPGTQVSANLAAVSEALSILLNLIGNQEAGTLGAGKTLVGPANTVGLFDSSNPIARGLAGVLPVDPNANRSIPQAS